LDGSFCRPPPLGLVRVHHFGSLGAADPYFFACCGIPPLPAPSPPLLRGERAGVRGDSLPDAPVQHGCARKEERNRMKISPCGSVFVPAICTLTSSFRFPLQARGTTVWFPPPAGGTCRRGQKLHTNLPCTRWAGNAGVPARNGNCTQNYPYKQMG
jgi:hypothetical protein